MTLSPTTLSSSPLTLGHLAASLPSMGARGVRQLVALVCGFGLALHSAQAIEEPCYRVERVLEADRLEIRRYDPYVVAEVVVPGPAEKAVN